MNTVKNDEEERIRLRAFELWEEAGRPEGKEYTHWVRARQEIAEENERETAERETVERTSSELSGQALGTNPEKSGTEDRGKVIRSDRFAKSIATPKKPLDERDIDTQLDDPE